MANFLVEIAERFDTPIHPTPSNGHSGTAANTGRRGVIYEVDISEHPAESYWASWGFHHDNFAGTDVMLYFGRFLRPVTGIGDLRLTPNSLFVDGGTAYIHIPIHPWLFPDHAVSTESVVPFLAAPLDSQNPIDIKVNGVRARTWLEAPNFTVRLSDSISGVSLKQGFSFTLANNNGFFDDANRINNIFNTPVYLKKAAGDIPGYADFKMIRDGLVESTNTDFNRMTVNVADRFRALEDPVCGSIGQWGLGFDVRPEALNRPMPLVFGTKRINLTRLDDTRYMTGENVARVLGVFDGGGNAIGGFTFNPENMVLAVTAPGAIAVAALVEGGQENRLGHVVKSLLDRAGILFTGTNFNTAEFDAYADGSFRVNVAVTRGTVRSAIEGVLRSDIAFLVQQTDGRFTMRSYKNRNTYTMHEIRPWETTKSPERDFSKAHENFFSGCLVTYENDGGENAALPYESRVGDAERRYRRIRHRTFDTGLTNGDDAMELAGLLADRYATMRESLKLAVGRNTANFELMDRVSLDPNINGRAFGKPANYILTGINHSQDILELEGID